MKYKMMYIAKFAFVLSLRSDAAMDRSMESNSADAVLLVALFSRCRELTVGIIAFQGHSLIS